MRCHFTALETFCLALLSLSLLWLSFGYASYLVSIAELLRTECFEIKRKDKTLAVFRYYES